MTRAHVSLIVLLAFFFGPVGCREPNRSFQSSEKEASTSENHSQSAETSVNTKEPVLIYLAIGSFDPLFQASPVGLPQELTLQRYPRDGKGYYLLQFKGPVLQKWKEEVSAAGVDIFDYIPQFAFVVKMDNQSIRAVEAMESVRWIGIYQPGYRIAPDLMGMLSEKEDRAIKVIVSVFKGEDASVLRGAMERLGGENFEVSRGGEMMGLLIPGNKIGDLARLSGVRYIERAPEYKLFPTGKQRGE
ncbi:MAG: hypothetical protein GWN93_00255 [Deltaproteobacteria bacterium]|nr:hypothetical protein [Deltaproteobacteria bacterium]